MARSATRGLPEVSRITKAGEFGIGNHLYVKVDPNKDTGVISRYYVFGYTSPITGKWRRKGLGSIGLLQLTEARKAVSELWAQVLRGVDPLPLDPKRPKRLAIPTFDELVERYLVDEGQQKEKSRFERVAAKIGKRPITLITSEDLVEAFRGNWREKD